jgi:hypothetical protein
MLLLAGYMLLPSVTSHPYLGWTRARLETLIGTHETLTLEFKSMRSLLAVDGKDKEARLSGPSKALVCTLPGGGPDAMPGGRSGCRWPCQSSHWREARLLHATVRPSNRECKLRYESDRCQRPHGFRCAAAPA